jgi:alpha-mannosidase
MNNYWNVNYVAGQGGDFTFRYVITSAPALDPPALSRMGWEALTPLETDVINYEDKSVDRPAPLDPVQSGFLKVDNPDLVLLTWKQAEDHNGYILRFVEMAGRASTVGVSSPIMDFQSAWRCNAMEENQQRLAVSDKALKFDVGPYEIVTVRVQGESTPATAH